MFCPSPSAGHVQATPGTALPQSHTVAPPWPYLLFSKLVSCVPHQPQTPTEPTRPCTFEPASFPPQVCWRPYSGHCSPSSVTRTSGQHGSPSLAFCTCTLVSNTDFPRRQRTRPKDVGRLVSTPSSAPSCEEQSRDEGGTGKSAVLGCCCVFPCSLLAPERVTAQPSTFSHTPDPCKPRST